MAAKPLSIDLQEKIKADWRTGGYSQQKLADKWKVSKGAVNKLCKDLEQDVTDIVNAGIAYKSGLAAHDDRIVTAVTAIVDERTKALKFFANITERNLTAVDSMLNEESTLMDRLTAQTIYEKGRITWIGKEPQQQPQTNINMNTAGKITRIEFVAGNGNPPIDGICTKD